MTETAFVGLPLNPQKRHRVTFNDLIAHLAAYSPLSKCAKTSAPVIFCVSFLNS